MTDSPAPQRLPTICPCCGKQSSAWDVLIAKPLIWMPLDHAYLHVCVKHLTTQTVDAAAPIKAQRISDPERALHHRRQTGARAALSAGRAR